MGRDECIDRWVTDTKNRLGPLVRVASGVRLAAAYPGSPCEDLDGLLMANDLDEALAMAGIDLVIVGGPLEFRGEALRRAAAEGLAIICLHPPGRIPRLTIRSR